MSVVLPVYNQDSYLPAALDGVFAQSYPHFELVVVDDGSTDGTAAVLERYQRQYEFEVVTQSNQGLPRALNTGFSRARGEYLTWTSSDNIMLPDMLSVLTHALEKDPSVGLVYADFYLMDAEGQDLSCVRSSEYDPYWLLFTNLVRCCFLYRWECMERVGGYDPEFIYGEDWEYWIRISQHYRMKHVPQVLYRYRLHSTSMTGEILRGTAQSMGHSEFAARIRKRMPVRWYIQRLKRLWAYLWPATHPMVKEREDWMRMTAGISDV